MISIGAGHQACCGVLNTLLTPNKPLGEAVQDAITTVQASSDKDMYQLFSDRFGQKMTIFPMFLMCREAALQTALTCSFRVRQLSSATPRLFTFSAGRMFTPQTCKKCNVSGFRPPLCTYRLNWARRTS